MVVSDARTCEPAVSLLPFHWLLPAPLALQDVALVVDHVSVLEPLYAIVFKLAFNVMTGTDGGTTGGFTFTCTVCVAVTPAPVHVRVKVLAAFNACVCTVPASGLTPDHAPPASHFSVLVLDQVNALAAPNSTVAGSAVNVTLGVVLLAGGCSPPPEVSVLVAGASCTQAPSNKLNARLTSIFERGIMSTLHYAVFGLQAESTPRSNKKICNAQAPRCSCTPSKIWFFPIQTMTIARLIPDTSTQPE